MFLTAKFARHSKDNRFKFTDVPEIDMVQTEIYFSPPDISVENHKYRIWLPSMGVTLAYVIIMEPWQIIYELPVAAAM